MKSNGDGDRDGDDSRAREVRRQIERASVLLRGCGFGEGGGAFGEGT